MHQLNYKTSMSNSRYGLSAQFWRTMAWSYAFKTWPFRNLLVQIFLPALSYLLWEKSTTHFACNGFKTKSRTSTLVSWCATPRPSCAATWSAYQVWYLSGRKHLEDLLKFIYLTVGKGRFCLLAPSSICRYFPATQKLHQWFVLWKRFLALV